MNHFHHNKVHNTAFFLHSQVSNVGGSIAYWSLPTQKFGDRSPLVPTIVLTCTWQDFDKHCNIGASCWTLTCWWRVAMPMVWHLWHMSNHSPNFWVSGTISYWYPTFGIYELQKMQYCGVCNISEKVPHEPTGTSTLLTAASTTVMCKHTFKFTFI